MKSKLVNFGRRVVDNLKHNRVAQGVGLALMSSAAAAQSSSVPTLDTTDMLAAIAAGVAAAFVVSAAYSSGIIGVKASKLPRRGA